MTPETCRLVVLAHGTRDPAGIEEARCFARRVEERLNRTRVTIQPWQIHIAFLEFAQPDILTQLQACILPEIQMILLVPLFLFQAGHMLQDIPELIDRFIWENPRIKVEMLEAVEYNDVFVRVLTEKLQVDVAHDATGISRAIVLIGRGNRDKRAQRIFGVIARQLGHAMPGRKIHVGYIAGSGEHWTRVLDRLEQTGVQHLYLQPYLWFHGRLTQELVHQAQEWAACHPRMHSVRIGEPLGLETPLVNEMARRIAQILFDLSNEAPSFDMQD